MPTFNVKQVDIPLFGVVENSNQAGWRAVFSNAAQTIPVTVDDEVLGIIATDLELDAEGIAVDAERYVNGRYRSKARGLDGSRLGDIGEILTFLVYRASGSQIERVVSWRPGNAQTIKGARFPQPDFIITDGTTLSALEVKSTEAFDFIDFRDTKRKWMWLQPCASVGRCRERALPQLGFVNGSFTQPSHSLVRRDGCVVPYPVGRGVAAAVIAVDGRANTLRTDSKYKTPKPCRELTRDCWSCLPDACHFVLVKMPNAPGVLSLGGAASDDGSAGWFRAYQRWSQALAARELFAAREMLRALVDQITPWLAAPDRSNADLLRAFWRLYLQDAMRGRGFNVELPESLSRLNQSDPGIKWDPVPISEPTNREGRLDDITDLVSQDQTSDAPLEDSTSFAISALLVPNDENSGSVSVRTQGDHMIFDLVSEAWWKQRAVDTIEDASKIATRLLNFAMERSGFSHPPPEPLVFLREMVAHVGTEKLRFGWVSKSAASKVDFLYWLKSWWYFECRTGSPPWPALLVLGDSRVRLRVMPDGRASLSVLRALLRRM